MNLPWNYSDKNSPQNDQWLPCYFLKIQAMGDNDTAEHMLDPEKDSTHEFMMFENFNCEKQA